MRTPGLLRSWIKEERRRSRTAQRRKIPSGVLMLGITLATVAGLRFLQERHRHSEEDEAILSLVDLSLHSLRTSAATLTGWKPLGAALSGGGTESVVEQLRTSGGMHPRDELLLFSPSQELRLAVRPGDTAPAPRPESLRCVQERLKASRNPGVVPIACAVGDRRIQLGVLAPVSPNRSAGDGPGTLAILRPIHGGARSGDGESGLRQALASRLRWQATPQPGAITLPLLEAARTVAPTISAPDGRVLALVEPPLPRLDQRSLLPDLAIGSLILAAILGARAIPMLEHRRRRLLHYRAERMASHRIRRTSRKLDLLLEKLGHSDNPSRSQPVEDEVMARLFGSSGVSIEGPPPRSRHLSAQVEHKMTQVAARYERFLSTARALALFDSLTDLPNRRYFFERLEIESQQSRRRNTSFVIMFIDVDKFKMINDTYGHHVGDAALMAVADRMREISRKEDFIARYGGDEFAMIMDLSAIEDKSEANLKAQAYQFASRLTETLNEPMNIAGMMLPISLSIGITLVDSQEADPAAAIQRSDAAMYQAKKQIESRISVFDISTNPHELDSYKLFADLQTALSRHDLRILYQPIVEVGKGLHAVEALVRWTHPELGEIPPDVLLDIADRYRLTLPLGLELIVLAARGYASIRASLGGEPRLALNISGRLLSHPDMGQTILNLLNSQLVQPERVTLEITEQSVMEMGHTTEQNLEFLRASGMQLSLDDFGTGHSSLMRLITLQPSELKIDKAFVGSLQTDPNAMRVVTLVAGLARRMNLGVVAEGVETREISQLLLGLGITNQQGYYFSKARTSGDLIAGGQRAFQRLIRPEG
ncbi:MULTISPECIES: putative bifunctional diguanylate cyclase/phosphodiesterase [Aphanothece]|uniref:putative bifunctional diguanylate cyclase/phosphodiesterase n=1 Tax=Aphanothece TaxID=1121 RepID=UPI0039849A0F